jgi:hypothetical protein
VTKFIPMMGIAINIKPRKTSPQRMPEPITNSFP